MLALVVDFGGPLVSFWLPRLGRTPMSEWTLRGGHLAERMQLVLIIALGESIIVTGTGFSQLGRSEHHGGVHRRLLGSAALDEHPVAYSSPSSAASAGWCPG